MHLGAASVEVTLVGGRAAGLVVMRTPFWDGRVNSSLVHHVIAVRVLEAGWAVPKVVLGKVAQQRGSFYCWKAFGVSSYSSLTEEDG